ncbi:MAG: class I SAM-dependent methyltransferase [Parahaliea sp.]
MVTLPAGFEQIRGFLSPAEGLALYRYARAASALGPILEIGSYCGKSTLCLGTGASAAEGTVYAIDHHGGSEEHQPGEFFHDPALYNKREERFDSFGEFRRNIRKANLEDVIVPVVSHSKTAARHWRTPLAMVFIDGGHSLDAALDDYRGWSTHLLPGGILAIHDIFSDPAEGGQAPWTILQLALQSGLFEEVEQIDTLAILRRL